MRDNRMADSQAAFRHLWTRYPNSPEAREASMRLSVIDGTGSWHPTSDELYNRALAFSALALHAETVEDLHKFLSLAPQHAKRDEAKFKLGTALVRLKRYDEALTLLKRGAEMSKEDPGVQYQLFLVYSRLKLKPEADAALVQFKKLEAERKSGESGMAGSSTGRQLPVPESAASDAAKRP